MLSREYNRLIEVWLNDSVTDDFGGLVTTSIFVKKIWSKATTNVGNKFINFGIQDFKNPVIFSVRGVKNGFDYTENHFIKYQGKEFYIKGTQNKGLESMELELLTDEI